MEIEKLSPDQFAKFERFRNSYEWSLVWLADAGGRPGMKEMNAWEAAKRDVPLEGGEEELFYELLSKEPTHADTPHRLPPIEKPE